MSVVDRIASLTPEQRELFEKLRQQRQQERSAARVHQPPPIAPVSGSDGAGDWPLSLDQERFWFMEQLHPGRAGLNIVAATRMRGRLAVPPLAAALDEITRRHAAWRTTFPLVGGAPVQRVAPPRRHRRQRLALVDLAALPAERRDPEALRLVGDDAAAPFDLERGPLMRASLIRLTADDFVCLLTIHHLVTDWVSFQIAWGELAVLYDAYATGNLAAVRELPAPPVHYPDFAVWQREWLQGEVLADLVAWWRERLAGVPLALEIPTDRPRPPVARMRGGQLPVRIPGPLAAALRALARGEGATLFMTVMAATAALLHRDSGQERLILGANNANRNRPELAPVLGCFLTQVPFTLDLSGDPSFRELLARARQSALASYAHQDLPFGKLVEAVQPPRDTSRQPVVQTLIQVLDGQISQASLAGVTFAGLDAHDGNARYDLMLSLFDYPDRIDGTLEYDSDLFDAVTTVRRLERFLLQAAAVTADPDLPLSALPVLPEGARQQALVEWNDTGRPIPGWTAPERFAAQAARTPEALAVTVGSSGEALSYGELDRRADALARRLLRLGIGAEARVALLLDRNLDLPVAILGVWKAGGAYLPLDPESPAERLADLLADAEPSVVIHRGAPKLPADEAVRWLDLAEPEADSPAVPLPTAAPGDLAYLIYTSGTTGKPKAVMIEHGQLAVTLETVVERFALASGDRVPHLFRATFDASLMDLVAPLLAGAAVEIVSREELLEPERLLAALERSTVVFTVPALLRRTLAGARGRGGERFAALRGIRAIGVGADLVAPELQQELLEAFPAAAVEVLYGPTEAAIICAAHRVPRGVSPERALIGRPLPAVELRVMSPHGEAVALGVPGELWIGGAGVARGYFRRDELTAERFVIKEGRRFYRSGDLVRQVAEEGGSLEFLGRIDHQVKVRGFRVEPGEIEAVLREHPAVREAVVVSLPDAAGDRYLAAYYVAESGRSVAPAGLREHLAARLPAYMVPSAFVLLPALPLTANGKVDRASLPAPAPGEAAAAAGDGPRTPAEEVVAGIWCEVLGLPQAVGTAQISRTANFFELGGHSLLATQVVSRLRAATGAEMAVGEMFQSPTVAALAAALETSLSSGAASAAAPPLRPAPRQGDLPLSFAQERLWFLDRLAPGNAAYNIPLALAARGELSLPALAAALGEMVRRHEALRTTYAAHGDRPVQAIAPAAAWALPLIDLTALPGGTREGEVRRLADALVARPFDLDRDPVLRASALRLGSEDHALLLVVHHIASDGWSLGVIVEEIAALYPAALAGVPSPLPELAVQYADFAVWQRGWLQGEALERQLGYWRQRLAGAAALDLPTDRPRPAAQSFRGATRMQAIGPEATAALGAFARRHDATLFMVLLAAVQTLLGRYAGQEDVVVGSPIANRTRAEIEPLIGFFVNSLVLRGDLAGDPAFAELVGRSRRAALEAYAHQDLPFERLVEELRPDRRLAHNPLFQVMFAVQNAPMRAIELPGISFSAVDFEFPATRFDLEIFFTEAAGALAVQLTYGTDLFDAATIARLEGHLDTLLAAVLADPSRRLSELALLTAPEMHQVRLAWNDTAAALPAEDVASLFSAQARRRPEAIAVSAEEGELSYAELDGRSSRLARRLAAAGVGPEVRVALLAQRSPAMIVGLLGILKAGGAYVPLDPSYPAERLAWMLADSGSRVLLGQPELLAELPEDANLPVIELTAEADLEALETDPELLGPLPGGLAYVMYTSGSTGRPKGVGVAHRNIVRLVRESGFADLGEDQVFLQLAPISFDASTLEIWAPLVNGGRIAIFPPRRPSLAELGEAIARFGVTSLWLTAGLFHQMVDERLEALRPLRQLLAGGDVLSPSHVRRALAALPGLTLINGYGPTEGTTFTCCFPMTSPEQVGSTVPLGRPIGNTRVHVLDAALGSAPAGVWGELCLGGDGLSRGYLGRPELTAERFVPDPFADSVSAGSRLYRTGDVVRFRPDGRVEFNGRRDGQVKLRGFRIELGEIESALVRHPAVREATVVARDDGGPLGQRLVAYVVPRPAEATVVAEPDEAQADRRHVEQWRELYEQTYAKGTPAEAGGDATFNLQGWNSSYTGEPIPAAEMREWLDGTVGRLLALPHHRVLEVGCGTGLLLFRVAPEAERYRGTDFSDVALAQVHTELARRALPQVELAQGLADDWTGVQAGDFDLVVLNSVVQYFPGVDYLVKVLAGAVAAVAPGGSVFVGDVRSLPLLEALHASVQLHRASGSLPVAELVRRVGRRAADEEELVIDPALFLALARRLPAVRRVQVLLKRGRGANELTRFRYDVVLDVGPARSEEAEPEILPQAWESLASLERRLAARPAALAVAGIPNARLAGEAAALDLLHGEGREMETVDELRAEIATRARAGAAVEPEDLWALADRLGYDADLTPSAGGGVDGRFDAVLRRRGTAIPAGVDPRAAAPAAEDLPWSAYANDPLRADHERRLAPELRRFLEAALPDYMVPAAFVLLDALPLTVNGKVDRAALPAPEPTVATAEEWVPPATPLEERLARATAEVLGLERVGMRDNFFDLGGHSLLATQLVSRLTQGHGIQVTLQMVFDAKDLGELADRIVETELAAADAEELDAALREVDGLSADELRALLEPVEETR
jgi:amino acid adenylation domain-containing protein